MPVLPDACTDLIWQSGVGAFVAGPDTGPAPAAGRRGPCSSGRGSGPGRAGPRSACRSASCSISGCDPADLPALPRGRLPGSLPPEEAMRRVAAIAAEMVTERPPDRLVLEAARLLGLPGARAELVAGQLGIGERQLRRRCQAAVGYGPRMLEPGTAVPAVRFPHRRGRGRRPGHDRRRGRIRRPGAPDQGKHRASGPDPGRAGPGAPLAAWRRPRAAAA